MIIVYDKKYDVTTLKTSPWMLSLSHLKWKSLAADFVCCNLISYTYYCVCWHWLESVHKSMQQCVTFIFVVILAGIIGNEITDSLSSRATVVDIKLMDRAILNAFRDTGWNKNSGSDLDSISLMRFLEMGDVGCCKEQKLYRKQSMSLTNTGLNLSVTTDGDAEEICVSMNLFHMHWGQSYD